MDSLLRDAANHPVVIGLGIVASFIAVAMALEQSRVLRSALEYLRVRPHMLRLIFDLCLIALLTIGVLRVVSFGTPASPPELEDKITSWAYRNLGWTVRHLDDPDAFFRLEVRVTSDTDPIPFYIVLHKKYPDTIFVTSTTVVPFGPHWKGMAEKDRRYFIAGLRERLLLLGVQYTGLDSDAKDSLRIDFTNTLAGSRLLTMEEFHRAVGAVQRATKLVTNAVERESWRLGFFDKR